MHSITEETTLPTVPQNTVTHGTLSKLFSNVAGVRRSFVFAIFSAIFLQTLKRIRLRRLLNGAPL